MDKASYLKAVRKAERVFGYIAVMPDHNVTYWHPLPALPEEAQ